MKVRLPPMKNHMHFRKQSDGHSWLVFTRPATGGRRSIAIIHIPDPHRDPTIEWLPGIEHAEHPQVEKLAGEIRQKRLTFETKQSSAPASVSAALPSDAPASEPEAVRKLILCEGETEQRYFEALCGFLGLKDRIDVKVSPAKEPCLVLRNLAKDMLLARQINEVEYGQAWLVFDRDSHLTFHDAVELGKKIPFIHLAFTKDEFVAYLMLHLTKKQTQRALIATDPAPAALSIPDDACHYNELRTLTAREMARIQSFPDNYFFRSKMTTGGQNRRFEVPIYTQIGNAVPVLLGRALGVCVKNLLLRVDQKN